MNSEIIREPSSTELEYYKANPHVGGMADFDSGTITINPYSSLSDIEKQAVVNNEHARLIMKKNNLIPKFDLTPEQVKSFSGYGGGNEQAIKETIIGRIISGDPSALNYTPKQKSFADTVRTYIKSESPKYLDYYRLKNKGAGE